LPLQQLYNIKWLPFLFRLCILAASVHSFLFSAYFSWLCYYRPVLLTSFIVKYSFLTAIQVLVQSIGVLPSDFAVLRRMFDAELFLRPRRLPHGQPFIVTVAVYVTRTTDHCLGLKPRGSKSFPWISFDFFGTAYLLFLLKLFHFSVSCPCTLIAYGC